MSKLKASNEHNSSCINYRMVILLKNTQRKKALLFT